MKKCPNCNRTLKDNGKSYKCVHCNYVNIKWGVTKVAQSRKSTVSGFTMSANAVKDTEAEKTTTVTGENAKW